MKYLWQETSGEIVNITDFCTRKGEQLFKERTGHYPSGMRMGRYSIAFGGGLVFVAAIYPEHSLDDPRCHIKRNSKFWDSSRRDRLSQIKHARELLKGHPLEAEVEKEMQREVEFLG